MGTTLRYIVFVLTMVVCTATLAVGASNGEGDSGESVFFDLPSLLIRLNTPNQRATYLKAKIVLELADPGMRERVEKMLPRVLDNIQTYLPEARVRGLRHVAQYEAPSHAIAATDQRSSQTSRR